MTKIGIAGFRIYATVTNVHTWTDYPGYDPEVSDRLINSATVPNLRTYTFGASLRL